MMHRSSMSQHDDRLYLLHIYECSSKRLHRIVHGYAMIDDSIVWRTITDELPFLSAALEQILRDEGVSGEA